MKFLLPFVLLSKTELTSNKLLQKKKQSKKEIVVKCRFEFMKRILE